MVNWNKILDWWKSVAVAAFLLWMLWSLFILTYGIWHPAPEQVITFNVTGVVNASNSTMVDVHFACIKECNKQFYQDYTKLDLCYKQCTKLGGCQIA